MARRARFGLQPRVQANIQGQLVAIAREQQSQEEQNIMDAWRNGGTFNGAPATDDRVLAYWKAREKGLDPHDPLFDEAKNNIQQLEYSIAMSKQDVLHAQHKISDAQYAQFFINWEKKVPKNSEFYRTLQKDAANLLESAKASARTSSNAAKTKAFNDFVAGVTDKDILLGNALTTALGNLAHDTGLNVIDNGEQLLGMLANDLKSTPKKYHVLLDALGKNWDGTLTQGFVAQAISDATNGYSKIASKANKEGFASSYYSAGDSQGKMAAWGQNLGVWSTAKSYDTAFSKWSDIFNDPHASVLDKNSASATLADTIQGMIDTTADPGAKAALQADLARLQGQTQGTDIPGFGSYIGHKAAIDDTHAYQLLVNKSAIDALHANPDGYAYAPVDKNGNFDVTGQGPIGIVPKGSIPAASTQVVITSKTGQPIVATIATHTVYGTDPLDPQGKKVKIGETATYWTGAQPTTLYSYKGSDGVVRWSTADHAPFAPGATVKPDGDSGDVVVTPPAVDSKTRAQQIDAKYGTNLAALFGDGSMPITNASRSVDTKNDQGDTTRITATYNNGHFQVTSQSVTRNGTTETLGDSVTLSGDLTPGEIAGSVYSATRVTANSVPGVTWTSPLQASIDVGRNQQSVDQTTNVVNDPEFRKTWLQQTMDAAGTTDPYNPVVASEWSKTLSASLNQTPPSLAMPKASWRTDLVFPGANPNAAPDANASVAITWGNQKLTLPNVPGVTQNANIPAIPQPFADMVNGVLNRQPAKTDSGTPIPVSGATAMTPVVAAQPTSIAQPTSKPVGGVDAGTSTIPTSSAPPAAPPPPPPPSGSGGKPPPGPVRT